MITSPLMFTNMQLNPKNLVLVLTLFALTACKGRKVEDPLKPLDPLTGAQSAQFDSLINGLGRPEQIVRVMTSTAPGWGTTDPETSSIKNELTAKGCDVTFVSQPTAEYEFRRLLQVTGTTCPLQLNYDLKQTREFKPFTLVASFLFTSEALAQANGLRGGSFTFDGNKRKTTAADRLTFNWNLSGRGSMTLFEGNKNIEFVAAVMMTEINESAGARQVGTYRFDFNGLESILRLAGSYEISAAGDKSKFQINGTEISKSAFEAYLAKLGFFAGLDFYND